MDYERKIRIPVQLRISFHEDRTWVSLTGLRRGGPFKGRRKVTGGKKFFKVSKGITIGTT